MQTPAVQPQYNSAVTKSNALIEANYKLSTIEQKIILYIISQIRKDDADFKMYKLPIQEFSELLGYRGSPKYTELREITKNLMRKVLEIREGQKLKQLSWVSYVEYDEHSGYVSLAFDPRLKPYLLQLKREFTTYRLKNVMELKSSYSIRMYELLKRWQYMGEVVIRLDDLRMMVGAGDKYSEYHNFKKRVLNPAKKEIAEKTDIMFTYEEIREKRKVARMYELLKRWQYMGEVVIRLDDLRMMVGAGDKYSEYHNFKKRVLNPAKKEIAEKTDIMFTYEEIREKRKVAAIRFQIREKVVEPVVVALEEKKEAQADDRYLQFLAVVQAYDRYITEQQFTKIAVLAQKAFGGNWMDELIQTARRIMQRNDIREPIAFLTYFLNEKVQRIQVGINPNEVTIHSHGGARFVRREIVPDWLRGYEEQLAAESAKSKEVDEDIEQMRRELEERLKKYKD
ncbi:replication initiation protein [Geobacillus thermopakistaniensis]|nr:replication initiation protein [Geobacillus sp. MAS1]